MPPRVTKAQRRAWRQQQRDTPAHDDPAANQLDSTALLHALVALRPSEDVVGQVRDKIPPPVLVEKKKERKLADLRDERNKLLKQLDKIVEDAKRKRLIYEEVAAEATALKHE